MSGRLRKARVLLAEKGPVALAHAAARFVLLDPLQRTWRRDRWLLGRVVEWRGNRARIDDVVVDLSHPHVPTAMKSRFLRGTYEAQERRLVREFVPPDVPVIELGGSIGVVATVTNRVLRDPTRHLVVEANPLLLAHLAQTRDENGAGFEILHAAYAPQNGPLRFYLNPNFTGGSAQRATTGEVTVEGLDLKTMLARTNFDRFTLIADIEGGEAGLIEQEAEVLARSAHTLILEYHPDVLGAATVESLLQRLEAHGFQEVARRERVVVHRNVAVADGATRGAGASP